MKTKLKDGQKFPVQFRNVQLSIRAEDGEHAAELDKENRIIKNVRVSSNAPIERGFGIEILSHEPDHVDLGRLSKKAAPMLFNHDRNILLGKPQNGRLQDGGLVCDLKFSRNEEAKQALQDIDDGILTEVSIGYLVHKFEVDEKTDTYTATLWELFEVSLVTIPADASVGVGREMETEKEIEITPKKNVDETRRNENNVSRQRENSQESETDMKRRQFLLEADKGDNATTGTAPAAATVNVAKEREEAVTSERARVSGISDIETHLRTKGVGGRTIDVSEAASKFIREGKTVDEFRQFVMTNEFKAVPVPTPENAKIGMEEKDIRAFSLLRACRVLASGKELDGLEREVSDAAVKASGIEQKDKAVYIPFDVMAYNPRSNPAFDVRAYQAFALQQRINNVSSGPAGGYTVGTDVMPMIELLRNKTVLEKAGMTELTGLQGDVLFPTVTQGLTAYWVSETGTLTDSEVVFGQKALTPHRLGATSGYTTQFLAQSSLSVEQFFRNELMTAIRLKLDQAGLEGTGVGGEPLGVKNTPGINQTVTFSGAAAWADIVEFETGIEADNADIGSMAFIISVATGGKFKTALKVTAGASGDFLIMNDQANGYPVYRTNQVTGDIVFFGVWSQLIHGTWATQEIIVDPYRLKKAGQIEITANTFHDFLVRQPLAFNVSTDSGAQ